MRAIQDKTLVDSLSAETIAMGPTGNTKVVQIHPSRRCNLECQHCYSSSSPKATEMLSADKLKAAIDGLAAQHYGWASFSGGEPLLYRPLPEVLTHARAAGMRNSIVTIGMLLTPQCLDQIQAITDLLVISLDGKPASHNQMRNHAKAFDSMAEKLPELRSRNMGFGFIFTLTQYNLDELPWVIEFAAAAGARLLQIHPLEAFGAANHGLAEDTPDGSEAADTCALTERFRQVLDNRMAIQIDLVHSRALEQNPDSFFLGDWSANPDTALADQLSPLVIEADGEVVPLEYGFPREFSLGNLLRDSVPEMATRWRTQVAARLYRLSRDLRDAIAHEPAGIFNWTERILQHAEKQRNPEPRSVPLSMLTGSTCPPI